MAATQKLTLRCVFADDTTATYSVDNINPSVGIAADAKQRIMNFNAQQGGTLASKLKSKNGANWIMIDKATVTTTDRTYIF